MHVLLVEDSDRLRTSVEQALTNSGYSVTCEQDGREALWRARNQSFDVMILDIMLPGLDGFQILEQLREEGYDTPVLCLTARDTIDDRVKGLQKGADDYLVKPFELRELLARIHALCRRRLSDYATRLTLGDLEVDRSSKQVTRNGQAIPLRPREYALLEYMMLRPDQVISRRDIELHIYGDLDTPLSNAVDSAVCAVRRKITVGPDVKPLIHTRRGQGYVLSETVP